MTLLYMFLKIAAAFGLVPGVLTQAFFIEAAHTGSDGMGTKAPWYLYPGVAINTLAAVFFLCWACVDVDTIVAALDTTPQVR